MQNWSRWQKVQSGRERLFDTPRSATGAMRSALHLKSQIDLFCVQGAVHAKTLPCFALARFSVAGVIAMEVVHHAPERADCPALIKSGPIGIHGEVKTEPPPTPEQPEKTNVAFGLRLEA